MTCIHLAAGKTPLIITGSTLPTKRHDVFESDSDVARSLRAQGVEQWARHPPRVVELSVGQDDDDGALFG